MSTLMTPERREIDELICRIRKGPPPRSRVVDDCSWLIACLPPSAPDRSGELLVLLTLVLISP